MTIQDLEKAGFVKTDDPQFIYAYPLADMTYLDDHDNEPAMDKDDLPELVFDIIHKRFCVWTGLDVYVYTNHTDPVQAIEWAKQISHFDSN